MQSLTSLGLSTTQALELLTHPNITEAQSSSDVLDGVVDASDRQEGGEVVQWLNDFEQDQRCVASEPPVDVCRHSYWL